MTPPSISPSLSPSQHQLQRPLQQPQDPKSSTTTRSIHRIKSHPTLSPFRRRIYLVLLSIPRGRWTTYAALARYMGSTSTTTIKPNPKPKETSSKGSARAVGTAMRTNPFAPDVPCHRVLASDGTLGGYMGDGPSSGGRNLQRKREILEAEGVKFGGDGDWLVGGKKGKGPSAQGECFVDFVG
ncbi:MGMT family protein [Aspergillus affinis]|uniref:MGMT family protein n=1 Tax=Aspergillus affinis TaxID=1070780 RepID=UPI0022FDB681|nr:uncharacterized protein KD926_000647 [Aspergillus affinis]KAI9037285.1 hypothetical protein KD926_000647 [Aspergillus affinis]